jgi:hypothetical protein
MKIDRVRFGTRIDRGVGADGSNIDDIGTSSSIDRGVAASRIHVDSVITSLCCEIGRSRMGASHRESIAPRTQRDLQCFNSPVGDTAAHTESADASRRQQTHIPQRITAVIHIQNVATGGLSVTMDGQQCGNAVNVAAAVVARIADHPGGVATYVDRVGPIARVEAGRTTDRSNVNNVVACIAVNDRRAAVGTSTVP